MEENYLPVLLQLISEGKLSELEAERLLNAAARLSCGVPTGTSNSPEKRTHI